MQLCSNSSALAMELLQSCTKSSIYGRFKFGPIHAIVTRAFLCTSQKPKYDCDIKSRMNYIYVIHVENMHVFMYTFQCSVLNLLHDVNII